MKLRPDCLAVAFASIALAAGCAHHPDAAARRELGRALTLHAGFDGTTDAAYARGDRRLQVGPQWGKPRPVKPGLPPGNAVSIAPGAGLHGDALRFDRKIQELVCYLAAGNIGYRTNDWSGTVSYWLKLDPERDLEPGYCDTIQITSKAWNDGSFFNDFSKDEKPRLFRLGVFSDLGVWNGTRKADAVSTAEQPMIPVTHPPFGRDRWTHVLFTWEHFNTGRADGRARFYLDGVLQGELGPSVQTFTWDIPTTRIMLGLAYTGLMDDLAIFDRALATDEIGVLRRLAGGVAELHR
ncbi:MAG: LamG domain-containing protein [Verrucomicrobia bacterium]|nr:MAG: LamG domain-containing protein [Verrucomicrobiota bacterium]